MDRLRMRGMGGPCTVGRGGSRTDRSTPLHGLRRHGKNTSGLVFGHVVLEQEDLSSSNGQSGSW